jgi:hypothetical protein
MSESDAKTETPVESDVKSETPKNTLKKFCPPEHSISTSEQRPLNVDDKTNQKTF